MRGGGEKTRRDGRGSRDERTNKNKERINAQQPWNERTFLPFPPSLPVLVSHISYDFRFSL